MADRVLVIGLDGATWTALDPLMAEGRMPALAALTRRGFKAVLESTVPPVTAPAWSSFITGCNPGQHGIYQFYEIDPWSERALGRGAETFLAEPGIIVNGKALGGPKLWEIASDAGLRCATINLPMTYPPSPINGLMVTDMLTPPGSRRFTTPPELADELVDYEIDLTPAEKDFTLGDDEFLARAETVLDKRGRAIQSLFEREPWDLFVAIFTETDRLQHRYWHVIKPGARQSAEGGLRERVVALYEKLDTYIGALIACAGDDVRIVVVSDHGFGSAAVRRVNLERVAVELGISSGISSPRRLAKLGINKRRVYKYLGWLVPDGRLRNAERLARDRALRGVKGKLVKLHDYIGGVWIHGEARGGPVPDAEATEFRDRIIEKLLGLRDPRAGARFVVRAVPREEIYSGERLTAAPDVIFFVDDHYGLDPTPRQRELVYDFTPPQTGTHRSDGIVSISGPGLVATRPAAPPRIEDVAPTVLHLLGLAVPSVMDGRVLEECFSDDLRRSRPVSVSHDDYAATSGVGAWDSESEQDEIMERLRGIGYVE